MKYGKLRIAWSVAWGVLSVLVCVLWVRSYWWVDNFSGIGSHRLTSIRGRLYFDERFNVSPNSVMPLPTRMTMPDGTPIVSENDGVSLAHWIPAAVAFMLLCVTWLPGLKWRFSLRTLLIAMTFAAVGLGIIAWMSRSG